MPNMRYWTTRFKRWFFALAFEVLRSVRMVERMMERRDEGT
jgi:hypothetical protein